MIRPARVSDASAIAEFWNVMIRDTLATFTTIEKTESDIAAMIGVRDGAFWVHESIETAGEVDGFATFGPFRVGPGYRATMEHTVILAQTAQGRGVGRALMAQVEHGVQKAGGHVLVAGISSANPGAVAFHARLGFQQTACMPEVGRKNGQWLDLIFMQKTISTP